MAGKKQTKRHIVKLPCPQGKVPERVVDTLPGHGRLFVRKTDINTVVLSSAERMTLDTMVEVDGDYHHKTYHALEKAIEKEVRRCSPA